MKQIDISTKKYRNIYALVDDDMFDYLNQWKWHYMKGYAMRREYVNGRSEHRDIYMHCLVNKTPKSLITDHINRDRLDNRRVNLRTANKSINSINTGLLKNNKSGHKGVFLRKDINKYTSYIEVNCKRIYLGCFNDIKDAILARRRAEGVYHAI